MKKPSELKSDPVPGAFKSSRGFRQKTALINESGIPVQPVFHR